MKSIVCMFTLTVALLSVTGLVLPPQSLEIHSPKAFIVKTLTFGYVNRLVKEMRIMNQPGEGFASLLPPFDDPAIIEPVELPIDISFPIDDTDVIIKGTIALTEETQVIGLGNIEDDFQINLQFPPPYKASWDLRIPTIGVNGAHNLDLVLDLGSSHTLIGAGDLTASVNEVFLHVLAEMRIIGLVRVSRLELDFGFSGLSLDGGDEVHLDDTQVNWETLSSNIQIWFDSFWTDNDEVKGLITEAVRCSADHVVNGCTVLGLIGGQDCLKVEINMECLAPLFPEPEPTDEPVTTIATEEPVSSTEGPASSTDGPASSTEGATEEPISSTEGPASSTEGATEEPVSSTEGPASSTEGPASSTEGATESTVGPVSSTEAPASSSQAPASSTTTTTEAPESTEVTTEGATESTVGPVSSTEAPASSSQAPASSTTTTTEAPESTEVTTESSAFRYVSNAFLLPLVCLVILFR